MSTIIFVLFVLLFVSGKKAEPIVEISASVPAYNLEVISVVSIRTNRKHECGGSIVSHMWVLTAGHCLREDREYDIVYGTLDSFEGSIPEPRYYRKIVYRILHPDFGEVDNRCIYDIGLAMVNYQFYFTSNVYPVRLPPPNYQIQLYQRALLVGWGQESQFDSRTPEVLQQVRIPVRELSDCHIAQENQPYEFCAGGYGANACTGDSGSPLLIDNMQIGLNSWTYFPCESHPGIYQAIAPYWSWIIDTVFSP